LYKLRDNEEWELPSDIDLCKYLSCEAKLYCLENMKNILEQQINNHKLKSTKNQFSIEYKPVYSFNQTTFIRFLYEY